MQIHRIHTPAPSTVSGSALRKESGAAGAAGSKSVQREAEAGGAAGNGELEQLSRQLGEFSDVRPDVVSAAKVRVQRGDYLTRASAEGIADAILSKDA